MMYLDEETNQALAPSRQRHYGFPYDPSVVSRYLAVTGQLNPVERNRLAAQNGRYLSGLGGAEVEKVAERAEYQEIYELEREDDVLGSGIFDPNRRPGTANADAGVFASHNSLPGYIARDRPFTISPEVADITANAAVVTVPGGGMAYVERQGRNVGPSCCRGPAPRSPGLRPSPPTGRMQPYAFLTEQPPGDPNDGWSIEALLDHADAQAPDLEALMVAPVDSSLPPQYVPAETPQPTYIDTSSLPIPPAQTTNTVGPAVPALLPPGPTTFFPATKPIYGRKPAYLAPVVSSPPTTAPYLPAGRRGVTAPLSVATPATSVAYPHAGRRGVSRPLTVATPPTVAARRPARAMAGCDYPYPPAQLAYQPPWNVTEVPTWPRYEMVPQRPSYRRVPALAGTETSGAGWGTYLAAGIIVGVAARVFWGAVKGGSRG